MLHINSRSIRQIARAGMKGRKRDTRLLCSVLMLSFLFITASSVLLSCVEETGFAQRVALYGNWQVMFYGAKAEQRAAFEGVEADGQAAMRIVGSAKGHGLVATIDQASLEVGGFTLAEGRLPQNENEILLVKSNDGSTVPIGQPLDLIYEFDHISSQAAYQDPEKDPSEETYSYDEIVYRHIKENWDELSTAFNTWWDGLGYDAFQWGKEYKKPAGELNEGRYAEAISLWAIIYRPEFNVAGASQYNAERVGQPGGITTSLNMVSGVTTYTGEAYGEDRGTQKKTEKGNEMYKDLLAYKTYTVCGWVEPYAGRWDTSIYEMPWAFVSEEAGRFVHEAVALACKNRPRIPALETEDILLFADRDRDAAGLFQTLLPRYNAAQAPAYRIDSYATDELSGRINGYLTGIEPETGEVVYIPFESHTLAMLFEYNGERYVIYTADFWDGDFEIDGLDPMPPEELTLESAIFSNTAQMRLNRFTYPAESKDAGLSMRRLILGILFSMTVCAVLQIFLTQLKRRTTKIVTMKAIGATNAQIGQMLAWEGAYVLTLALPVGFVLGMGFAFGAVAILNAAGENGAMRFTVEWGSVLWGLALGVAALVLGILLPLVKAVRLPLTGKAGSTGAQRLRLPKKPKGVRPQTLPRIYLRGLGANYGRTLTQVGITCLLVCILLISVFLSYNAFATYRETVEKNSRPDYALRCVYGMSQRLLGDTLASLTQLEGVGDVETYLAAENVYLENEGLLGPDGSPILRALYDLPSARESEALWGFPLNGGGSLAYKTDVYGIDVESELMERVAQSVTEGEVDKEKLAQGEECVLLVPLYREGASLNKAPASYDAAAVSALDAKAQQAARLRLAEWMELSYEDWYAGAYKEDRGIEVGDVITLTGTTQTVQETHVSESSNTAECRVAGIIRYFPETGLWPFQMDGKSHAVISGHKLVTRVYPNANQRMHPSQATLFERRSKLFHPDCYGKTYFYVYAEPGMANVDMDNALSHFAQNAGLTLKNYRIENQALYNEANNNMLMTVTLGASAALMVGLILANTIASALEQQRRRFGVLTAIGARESVLYSMHYTGAFASGIFAMAVANLVLLIALAATVLLTNPGAGFTVAEAVVMGLWRYPWRIHLGVCLLFPLIPPLMYLSPFQRLSRFSPVENIRG